MGKINGRATVNLKNVTYFTMELKIIYKYMITTIKTVKYNLQ